MSGDTTGQILGTAVAGVVLPATASATFNINYYYCLAAFATILFAYNIAIKLYSKVIK